MTLSDSVAILACGGCKRPQPPHAGKKCDEQNSIVQRTVDPGFNLLCSLNAPWFRSSLCSRVTRFLEVDQKNGIVAGHAMQRRRNAPGANRGAPRLRQPRMGPPQDEAGAAARAEARAEAACAAAAAVEATQPQGIVKYASVCSVPLLQHCTQTYTLLRPCQDLGCGSQSTRDPGTLAMLLSSC